MSLKYNIKQRYKSIQGLRSFKNTLPTEVKRIIDKKGQLYSETLDNWKYIVGNELFKVCIINKLFVSLEQIPFFIKKDPVISKLVRTSLTY